MKKISILIVLLMSNNMYALPTKVPPLFAQNKTEQKVLFCRTGRLNTHNHKRIKPGNTRKLFATKQKNRFTFSVAVNGNLSAFCEVTYDLKNQIYIAKIVDNLLKDHYKCEMDSSYNNKVILYKEKPTIPVEAGI